MRHAEAPIADPRPLAGHWNLELLRKAPLSRLPFVSDAEPWFFGDLDLRIPSDTTSGVTTPRDTLVGRFIGTLPQPNGDSTVVEFPASARLLSGGDVVLTLTFPCRCAAIHLRGLLADGEVHGRATDDGGMMVENDRFRMRRR